jgi:hypothetical protein
LRSRLLSREGVEIVKLKLKLKLIQLVEVTVGKRVDEVQDEIIRYRSNQEIESKYEALLRV